MTEQRKRILADGLVGGLLAYLVVVAFFAAIDVLGGRPLMHTPAFLGQAVFGGVGDPAASMIDAGLVLAFNGVHLVTVLLFAFFGAWLAYEAELHPEFWYVAFFMFLAAALLGYAGVMAATVVVGAAVSPWLIASAGLLSAIAVAGSVAGNHRPLIRAIRDAGTPSSATG